VLEERDRPRPAPWVVAVAALGYAVLFAPLLAILVYSFLEPVPIPGGTRLEPSLIWYKNLFVDAPLGEGLVLSLQIAAAASATSAVIGTFGALALERGRFPGRDALALLTLVPLVMPELVMGLSSLIWFATLRLTLGQVSIVLAHVTFTVSYVVVTVRARLADLDPALEEAAADLGAKPTAIFFRVTLPLVLPAVVAGTMMAFTLSLDDFLISFFTAGVGAETLPMRLYAMIRFGLNREMYALSGVLIVVTSGGLLAQYLIRRRRAAF
jgi:ABC-type spermidine/putrescine transport system permease subunit II